jgi:hypothetical protein
MELNQLADEGQGERLTLPRMSIGSDREDGSGSLGPNNVDFRTKTLERSPS